MSAPTVRLVGDPAPFVAALERRDDGDGREVVALRLRAERPAAPPRLALAWREPLADVAAIWTPAAGRDKGIPPDWAPRPLVARATTQAPVLAAVSGDGANRLTVSLSDALHVTRLSAGLVEESGELDCRVELFAEPPEPTVEIEIELRIDRRALPYERALGDVARAWAAQPGYAPSRVPEIARLPMYSTWYSFHQELDPAAVEAECRAARALGCEAVILDDGWQTLDRARGYAFTGDWRPERIPDLAGHVARLHAIGMKVILWYSVPFVGMRSAAWSRFAGKLLYTMDERGCGVLDPRYPEVREYLIGCYEAALREWDLDGLKLDFVDRFVTRPETPAGAADGRDLGSVDDAVDRLLEEAMRRLTAIKPDVLIEFRQSYIGPLMRKYGNMFRANDCPADHVRNRISIVDVRLLCGDTACHGDMLMWHPAEPVAAAALQLLAVLFSVPQISMRLDRLPADHRAMVAFWLTWWRAHRAALLEGELSAVGPEHNYLQVSGRTADELVVAAYGDAVVRLIDPPRSIQLVNATRAGRLVLETADLGERAIEIRDCQGAVVARDRRRLAAGLHRLDVPPAGLVTLVGS